MNQTWENGKKQILDLILARFDPNLVPPNFYGGFSSTRCYTLLQGKLINQIEKMAKKN